MIPENVQIPCPNASGLFRYGDWFVRPREIACVGLPKSGGELVIMLKGGHAIQLAVDRRIDGMDVINKTIEEMQKPFYL